MNWVKAQSECSAEELFLLLAEVVDSDVKEANRIRGNRFKSQRPTNKVIVLRNGLTPLQSIVFELSGADIIIKKGAHGASKEFFKGRAGLSPDGRCMLRLRQ